MIKLDNVSKVYKNEHAALRTGAFVPVDSSCPSTFAYMRHLPASGAETQDDETVLVIVNFASKGEQTGCTFSYNGGEVAGADGFDARVGCRGG